METPTTLFELTMEQRLLKEAIENLMQRAVDEHGAAYGEIPEALEPELDALLTAELAGGEDHARKVEGYCVIMAEKEAEADALDARADVLQARVDALRKRAGGERTIRTRLATRLLDSLQVLDLKRVEAGNFLVKRRRNGGKQPVVLRKDVTADDLPADFVRIKAKFGFNLMEVPAELQNDLQLLLETIQGSTSTLEIDKPAIYDAIKSGQELDFATLGDNGERLVIE